MGWILEIIQIDPLGKCRKGLSRPQCQKDSLQKLCLQCKCSEEEGRHPQGSVNKSACKQGSVDRTPDRGRTHARAAACLCLRDCAGMVLASGTKAQTAHFSSVLGAGLPPFSSFTKNNCAVIVRLPVPCLLWLLTPKFAELCLQIPRMLSEYSCPHQDRKRRETFPGP